MNVPLYMLCTALCFMKHVLDWVLYFNLTVWNYLQKNIQNSFILLQRNWVLNLDFNDVILVDHYVHV